MCEYGQLSFALSKHIVVTFVMITRWYRNPRQTTAAQIEVSGFDIHYCNQGYLKEYTTKEVLKTGWHMRRYMLYNRPPSRRIPCIQNGVHFVTVINSEVRGETRTANAMNPLVGICEYLDVTTVGPQTERQKLRFTKDNPLLRQITRHRPLCTHLL